jgi:hypothetical protein
MMAETFSRALSFRDMFSRGLEPGELRLKAEANGYALVKGDGIISVPDAETRLLFGPLVALVCRFKGDDLINAITIVDSQDYTQTNYARIAVRRERARLQERSQTPRLWLLPP